MNEVVHLITFSEQWVAMSWGSQPRIIGIRRPTAQNNNGKGAACGRNPKWIRRSGALDAQPLKMRWGDPRPRGGAKGCGLGVSIEGNDQTPEACSISTVHRFGASSGTTAALFTGTTSPTGMNGAQFSGSVSSARL